MVIAGMAGAGLLAAATFYGTITEPPPIQLVTFGDSITANPPQGSCSPTEAQSYSQVLAGLISTRQGQVVTLTQSGLIGSSWNYTQGTLPTLSGYLPGSIGSVWGRSIAKLVLFAGTNGLFLGSHTPAQEYTDFQATLATLQAEGYSTSNMAVVTMLPRQSYSETNRATYNSLLEGGASTYGYSVVNMDTNQDLGIANSQSNNNWYCPDLIHPSGTDPNSTGGGHSQLAYTIYDALYPGAAFTPTSPVTGTLLQWYDAQDGTTITQSGGKVSQWSDKSGNANHLTQPTGASQPTYSATGINGHPGIQFPADGSFLHVTLANGGYTANKITAFVVFTADDASATNEVLWNTSNNDSSWSAGLRMNYVIGSNMQLADDVSGGSSTIAISGTTAHLVTGYREDQGILSRQLFLDGTAGAINGGATSAYTVTGMRVGRGFGGFWPLTGKIGELIIYQGRLTAYERAKVEAYLRAKWGF